MVLFWNTYKSRLLCPELVYRNSYTGTRTVPDSYSCLCEPSLRGLTAVFGASNSLDSLGRIPSCFFKFLVESRQILYKFSACCVVCQAVLDGLRAKNHTIAESQSEHLAVVESIRSHCSHRASVPASERCIEAVSDGRKGGSPDGF